MIRSDLVKLMNEQISYLKENIDGFNENELSDGYHTFNELYEFRKMYNAALFNEWALSKNNLQHDSTKFGAKHCVHKSWRHYDGEECFPNSKHRWFIVSAMLPTGLISNHYKEKDWDLFKVPEVEKALFPFDGHTEKDVLERISKIL